jgi:hypothetical protein
MPNLAGRMAREYGVNGYAEAVDGAVFVAAMTSLLGSKQIWKVIVRELPASSIQARLAGSASIKSLRCGRQDL